MGAIMLLLFSCFCLENHLSVAADSISPGESISGNQTIVSKGGKFELGFFTPGNSHNYYIGIWYKNIPVHTVIWVANRERPVSNTASSDLKISEDGNLVLSDHSKIPIWSSKFAFPASNSTVAVLLDTGNLVLRERSNSSAVVWQSFDHPTDTWVPGAFVGLNKITGEYQILTSWKNSEDPAPGIFSHRIDPGGSTDFLVLWNGSVMYYHTGEWDGQYFNTYPTHQFSPNFQFSFVETDERKYVATTLSNNSQLVRLVMNVTGQLKMWTWLDARQDWMFIWSRPEVQCDVYSLCGAFGFCQSLSYCGCLHGFKPKNLKDWDLNDWSGGCVRKTQLQCSSNRSLSGENGKFLPMPDVQLPANPQYLTGWSADECKSACSNNCSCAAYAYKDGCSIWNGELCNIQQLSDGDGKAGTLYLHLTASELPDSSGKNKTVIVAIVVGAILGSLIVSCIVTVLIWRWRQRRTSTKMPKAVEGSLFQFKYTNLQYITKNFSKELGRGGFGSVFKGTLADSTVVAVKKLQGPRQGEKQFRSEVSTLGTIQHVNLVCLRGFCAEGNKRLLVYEYMPEGSLDSQLFRNNSACLDWKTRYQIALGTARGLAYLHEKCRECIIHCDIKPENILLDEDFTPKVADFGMAKLIGREFSRVLTTTRGTIGYLAPEWISGLAITPKVDVYSFGMMLFELISGRRNTEKTRDEKFVYFPVWAAGKVNEGEVFSLLDRKLDGNADGEELNRVCRAACWCIQDDESCRPAMGRVVQILGGVVEASMPPIPWSLQNLLQNADDSDSG